MSVARGGPWLSKGASTLFTYEAQKQELRRVLTKLELLVPEGEEGNAYAYLEKAIGEMRHELSV